MLIDTGEGKDEYIPLLQEAILDPAREHNPAEPRISDIILTHRHHDHVNGLPSVLALLRQLYDTQQPAPPTPFRPPRIHKILLARVDAHLATMLSGLTPGSYEPAPGGAPVHDLVDGDTMPVTGAGAGAALRVVHTPGHTPDSLCLHYPPDRALFTADTVLGHGTAVFEDLGAYMRSLRRMVALCAEPDGAYEVAYPGHGPVAKDGLEKVQTYLRHRVEREEQIVRVLEQPALQCDGWSVEAIVATIYARYPKELWGPAGHNVTLHLNKLEGDGRVKKLGDSWVLVN